MLHLTWNKSKQYTQCWAGGVGARGGGGTGGGLVLALWRAGTVLGGAGQ